MKASPKKQHLKKNEYLIQQKGSEKILTKDISSRSDARNTKRYYARVQGIKTDIIQRTYVLDKEVVVR